jgi:integral membrane protein
LVTLFRAVAFAEALSWAGLLAGMYAKYVTDAGELGVKVFGPIHGGIFVAYGLLTLLVARAQRWSWPTMLLGLAAAVPPFATAAFEVWAARSGRLAPAASHPLRGSGYSRAAQRPATPRVHEAAGEPAAEADCRV